MHRWSVDLPRESTSWRATPLLRPVSSFGGSAGRFVPLVGNRRARPFVERLLGFVGRQAGEVEPLPQRRRQHAGPLFDEQERLRGALTGQLWATSKVAQRKFRHATPAVWLLGASLFVAAAAGLVPA